MNRAPQARSADNANAPDTDSEAETIASGPGRTNNTAFRLMDWKPPQFQAAKAWLRGFPQTTYNPPPPPDKTWLIPDWPPRLEFWPSFCCLFITKATSPRPARGQLKVVLW